MKKFVLKLDLHDDEAKRKAMKRVSTLSGVDSISIDMNEKKLTVIGTVDPVSVASKLRKYWQTDLISVEPVKEPEKKQEPKKEEGKKEEEAKKEEGKKEEEPKKEEGKKGEEPKKEEAKTEEPKKEEAKKEETKEEKKEEEKKKEPTPPPDPVLELVKAYNAYNPHRITYHYVHSMEENPNSCVIF